MEKPWNRIYFSDMVKDTLTNESQIDNVFFVIRITTKVRDK